MRRFVVPALRPGELRLGAEESHHLLRVLRSPRGTVVGLTDGADGVADATLVGVDGNTAILAVDAVRVEPRTVARTVLLGVPKATLTEEAIQLGTEAGCTRFICVRAARSPLPAPRPERLERIAEAAAVQCGRARLPEVLLLPDLAAGLAALDDGARLLAHPGAPAAGVIDGAVTVAIGPEGGWTEAERATLRAARFEEVGFGPHVLRAPTAVAVALGALLPATRPS